MTAQPTLPWTPIAHPNLSAELLDALIQALVFRPNPSARSALISQLVEEIGAAVEWRQEGEGGALEDELGSVRHLVGAAHDHQQRMAALGPDQARTVRG